MSGSVQRFLEEIKIYDCGFQKIRIGNKSDGGYVALHEICENTRTLYAFGVEDNITFAQDFVDKFPHTAVKLFDHTVDRLPAEHPNFAFIKKGIAAKKSDQFLALSDMIDSEVGGLTIKMDIEWDEWATLASLSSKQLKKIDQLLVEFHLIAVDTDEKFIANPNDDYGLTPYFDSFYRSVYQKINVGLFDMYYDVMKTLNENFYAFHIHPNNSLGKINVDGHCFPPLIEVSFVRKALVKDVSASTCNFPISGLDFPNKPYKKEIQDYYPLA